MVLQAILLWVVISSVLTWRGDFSWDFCNTQAKLKTIVVQFFFSFWCGGGGGVGGQEVNKVHYGLCENDESCEHLSDM